MNIQKGNPPTMREKLFQRCSRGAFALAFFFNYAALAVPPPAGVAPLSVPAGGFRIDGDLMADVSGGDWLGGTNPAAGVLSASGLPLNPATTFHFADAYSSTADTTFAGGLKWTDDPNV